MHGQRNVKIWDFWSQNCVNYPVATIRMFVTIEFFLPVALRPKAGHDLYSIEVSRSHTTTHHSRVNSGRVVSLSQRPLRDNMQQSQQTDIYTSGGIRTHSLSTRAAADPRPGDRPHGNIRPRILIVPLQNICRMSLPPCVT